MFELTVKHYLKKSELASIIANGPPLLAEHGGAHMETANLGAGSPLWLGPCTSNVSHLGCF